ncbi:type IV pilin protein [uncultured Lamprocystis sp.]|nr:type IV pilin protein [uncultured Lamprocystis sp.]
MTQRSRYGRPGSRPTGRAGFTLIELMVTVAIVAILAAVAIPSYVEQVRRGNRAEAKGALMEDAQFLERNYTVNNCYHRTDARFCTTTAADVTLARAQSPATGTAKYTLSAAYSTPCTLVGQCFTLSAAPTGSMTGDPCGTLTLNQTGVQGAGDYDKDGDTDADDVAACWQR